MTPMCHAPWLEHPEIVDGQRVRVQVGKDRIVIEPAP